jgi:hypothetical protein
VKERTMNTKVNLSKYHHLVVLAKEPQKAVDMWAKAFQFEAPALYDTGPVYKQFLSDKFPSLYRGKYWKSDFKQAVFNQQSFFFEIDGTGDQEDCFTEFEKEHGNGICYFGVLAGTKRDDFVDCLNKELGCETIIDQKFPGGDWSVIETEKVLGCNLCVKKESGGDHTENSKLVDFSEISILVPDVEKAVEGWKYIFEIESTEIKVVESNVFSYKAAEMVGGPFLFHLIEPEKEEPFTDYVKEHGYGIFAVTVPVENVEEQKAHMGEACGFKLLLDIELFGKHYAIYDTVDVMGTNVAIQ